MIQPPHIEQDARGMYDFSRHQLLLCERIFIFSHHAIMHLEKILKDKSKKKLKVVRFSFSENKFIEKNHFFHI